MTYKETLFFVGQCLTINFDKKNKFFIEAMLKKNIVNWEAVVKLSTTHYVFPALYLNIQRAGFLKYLPEDLSEYMAHITKLNRERNLQIIAQAKEINDLLKKKKIIPVFLKGTAHILEELYEDIGERMIGDIDILVKKEDFEKTINVLLSKNYKNKTKNIPEFHRHYPALIHEKKIAAIEVHNDVTTKKYAKEFNYEFIKKDILNINNVHYMSYLHQLYLIIISKQINDNGVFYKNISLRIGYDVYLLSKKTKLKKAFDDLGKLKTPLLNYIVISHEVFGRVESLDYEKTETSLEYLDTFKKLLDDYNYRKKFTRKIDRILSLKKITFYVCQFFYDKKVRSWLLKKITS